jgi:hypothetical protein
MPLLVSFPNGDPAMAKLPPKAFALLPEAAAQGWTGTYYDALKVNFNARTKPPVKTNPPNYGEGNVGTPPPPPRKTRNDNGDANNFTDYGDLKN